MGDTLVGRDLLIDLRQVPGTPEHLAEVRAVLAALEAAVAAAWPGPAWAWMHGPDSVQRVQAALTRRVAGHVPNTEGGDGSYYGPFGFLVAQAASRTLVFACDLHGRHRAGWHLSIEPRLRRRLLGFITSDRIPGSRELDPPTAAGLTGVLRQVADHHGQAARLVPGNEHRFRSAVLVFP